MGTNPGTKELSKLKTSLEFTDIHEIFGLHEFLENLQLE